jgi:transposase
VTSKATGNAILALKLVTTSCTKRVGECKLEHYELTFLTRYSTKKNPSPYDVIYVFKITSRQLLKEGIAFKRYYQTNHDIIVQDSPLLQ